MTPLVLEKPTLEDIRRVVANVAVEDRREWDTTHLGGWSCNTVEATLALYMDGIAHVFRESDGTAFCLSGFQVVAPGVARSWTIRTDAWKRHLVECTRVSRKVIARLLESGAARRVEAWCPAWAERWPQALRLEKEAVLRQYANDGTDVVVWSRVKPCV